MFGFKSPKKTHDATPQVDNGDVAKLFFDSFSKRVATVEENLRGMSSELEKVKLATEHGQVSDLVLLERLQKTEKMIRESLDVIKAAVEKPLSIKANRLVETAADESLPSDSILGATDMRNQMAMASHILSPTGELGSLASITTSTELQALTLLASEGPKSAPEIGKALGRSREHTARLMKKLFEEGYVRRDQSRIPFRYSLVDRIKQTVKKAETTNEGKEQIPVPQT